MSDRLTISQDLSQAAQRLLKLAGPGVSKWKQRRHLIDTDDLSMEELSAIVEAAAICKTLAYKERAPQPVLSSRTVANLFYENSTRTRSSFELAARKLGATVLNLDIGSSSVAKGETIADTGRTLAAMGVDALVQRHQASGSAQQIALELGHLVHVINAGDGWHAHPTQALLDYFTMCEVVAGAQEISPAALNGRKIAIVGDIAHSRVARSNICLLKTAGAQVHVAGPPTLLPRDFKGMVQGLHERLEPAIEGADFIIVLRLQLERQKQGLIPSIGEYRRVYRLDSSRLTMAKPSVRVMHPGPMNRDIEISHELADNPERSLVTTQVANGVAVRMAVLFLLLNGEEAQ